MNITKICKRFGKLPAHFTDNDPCKGKFVTTRGCNGGTHIDDEIVELFLYWLHPDIKYITITQGIEAGLQAAETWGDPS